MQRKRSASATAMIVACPSCETRFAVAEAAVLHRPAGRQLRCGNCGLVWRQMLEARSSVAPLLRLDPEPNLTAPSEPPSIPPPAPRRHHGLVAAGWVVLILVIGAAVMIAAVARREIVTLWAPAARLYGLVGVRAEPVDAGLQISRIMPTRTPGGVVIAGEIENKSRVPRNVPQLRVVLHDAAQKVVQIKTIAPPKTRLRPGEVVHFKVSFEHPNDATTGVVVIFAPS